MRLALNPKRIDAALFVALLALGSCTVTEDNPVVDPVQQQKSIVILYENDVHCGIDGYAKLAGLRDAIAAADTAWVGVTSSGDFLNGDVVGAISRGQYIVDIMRHVGYDAITIGNHEYDFGVPRMLDLLPQIQAPVVCTNLYEAGGTKPMYPTYTIKSYGQKRIAFVGACTPESMRSEGYSFYDKTGKMLYDLRPSDMITLVQKSVDSARAAGADYVVLLSHLGEATNDEGSDSHTLISKTRGIDVVLDGHTHAVVPHDEVNNLDGKHIGVTQTGTQFANIGKLLITTDGRFYTSLIPASDVSPADANSPVTAATETVKTKLAQQTEEVLGTCDFELTINGADGKRLVRNGETNICNLCADAFREMTKSDIGLQNGGGIRNGIPAGTITFGHAIGTLPFYNLTCAIEATGTQIVNMLKKCTEKYPAEDGSFPHVAGMKYTLHAVSHTITDVQVLNRETGNYEPIVLDKKYRVGTSDYYSSGGFYRTLQDATLVEQTTEQICNTLANYIKQTLGGRVGDTYRESQQRVTIVND